MTSAARQRDFRPLAGRRALVTGGASGIGRAIAVAFANAGACVTVVDRDADATKILADEIGGVAMVADLSDLDETEVVEHGMLAAAAIKPLIEPEEDAALALFLSSDNASSMTGSSFCLDGGWTAH